MIPFNVDVSELLDSSGGQLEIDGEYPLPTLVVGDESFDLGAPANVSVSVTFAGSGLIVSGSVSAEVMASCARCLRDFQTTITGEVEGFYLPYGAKSSDDDEAGQVTADNFIDLAPAILAALVIEAPFAPLHDPKCAGLCPTCGSDLNEGPCGCGEVADASHPFAALEGMFDSEDSEE